MAPSIDVTMLAYSEPGIAHNIRSWLPHAKRIVVVIGATWEAEKMGAPAVDQATINAVKSVRDPNHQITVVHRNTYWKHKNEMAIAAGELVRSDIVWQVDADEYYHAQDIERAREELSDNKWEMAGMPHILFWRDLSHAMQTTTGEDWFCPSRIWRRHDGHHFLHLPFATIQRPDGSSRSAGVRRLDWGRCYHASWCPPQSRIKFKFAFHKARGDGPPAAWINNVWEKGIIPPNGIHPANAGIFPKPFNGEIPEPLRLEAAGWAHRELYPSQPAQPTPLPQPQRANRPVRESPKKLTNSMVSTVRGNVRPSSRPKR